MSVMTASRTELPGDRPLTVADLDLLPDDGNRYELDDGVLVMSPAPAVRHQLVLQRLSETLGAACPSEFLVLPGPGVEMSAIQYRFLTLSSSGSTRSTSLTSMSPGPRSSPSRSRRLVRRSTIGIVKRTFTLVS